MNSIQEVMTATEAAELWVIEAATVKRACQQGKFTKDEARKAKGVWLITRAGMRRVYGPLI